jgi:hypothetical protein
VVAVSGLRPPGRLNSLKPNRQRPKGRHRNQLWLYSQLQPPLQHQSLHQRLHHHQQLLHSLWLQ